MVQPYYLSLGAMCSNWGRESEQERTYRTHTRNVQNDPKLTLFVDY